MMPASETTSCLGKEVSDGSSAQYVRTHGTEESIHSVERNFWIGLGDVEEVTGHCGTVG